jgi:hypothetical protein
VGGVVDAVGEQPSGRLAAEGQERVDHRERVAAVVVVGRAQQQRKRAASAVAG